jgi:hypothetical protein
LKPLDAEVHRVIPLRHEEITVTIPDLRAGAMWRRTVRYAIRSAKVLGAQVDVAEQWALLGSRFTIRAVGTHDELKPIMNLAALAKGTR